MPFSDSSGFTDAPNVGEQINAVQIHVHGVVTRGYRTSKLMHGVVYNDAKEKIGTVQDLVVAARGDTAFVVLGVGGFLEIDEKLVAVPVDLLDVDSHDVITLPGATRQQVQAMPRFIWAD